MPRCIHRAAYILQQGGGSSPNTEKARGYLAGIAVDVRNAAIAMMNRLLDDTTLYVAQMQAEVLVQ